MDTHIVLYRATRFGCQTLGKTSCGHFWMLRRRGIFGKERVRLQQVGQCEAIAWSIRNGVRFYSDRLAMLGIRKTEVDGALDDVSGATSDEPA